MAEPVQAKPVRGTQLLVGHIGAVLCNPLLVAIEIGWRWLFGIPFLLVCWRQLQQMLAAYPLDSSGLGSLDAQNPWVAAAQISTGLSFYAPHCQAVLRWLLPQAALAWIVISGLGRALVLRRIDSRMRFRPFAAILFQAGWLALFLLTIWAWLRSMAWVAATHIDVQGEPNLIGYFMWAIFLALGFFTAFALASWPLSIAPMLAALENRSSLDSLRAAFRLGAPLTSKLVEINLVLGIVKLALMVLALVFSAAPLPFSSELGSASLHLVSGASLVFYLIANDLFQVVRLKAFLQFWSVFRGSRSA